MTPFLQLAFELVVILLAAKAAGYLSARLGQPSVLGELLAGVLLGPSLVNILGLRFINSTSLSSSLGRWPSLRCHGWRYRESMLLSRQSSIVL